jgi:dihydrofolate reductase
MGMITYGFNVSLDGFIEDSTGGFDWSVPDEALHRHFNEQERVTGLHLYGRGLWETMKVWGTLGEDASLSEVEHEYARLWQRVPTVVFSRTLQEAPDGVRLVREVDPVEIARLKESTLGELSLGGASLAAEFRRLGLIDEYLVYVAPVLVGSGKRMFEDTGVERLRLLDVERFDAGVTLLRYAPA